jgi:hypothetical protein
VVTEKCRVVSGYFRKLHTVFGILSENVCLTRHDPHSNASGQQRDALNAAHHDEISRKTRNL